MKISGNDYAKIWGNLMNYHFQDVRTQNIDKFSILIFLYMRNYYKIFLMKWSRLNFSLIFLWFSYVFWNSSYILHCTFYTLNYVPSVNTEKWKFNNFEILKGYIYISSTATNDKFYIVFRNFKFEKKIQNKFFRIKA